MDEKLLYCCQYLIKCRSVNKLHSPLERGILRSAWLLVHPELNDLPVTLTPDHPMPRLAGAGGTNQLSHQRSKPQMKAEEAGEQSRRAAARPR